MKQEPSRQRTGTAARRSPRALNSGAAMKAARAERRARNRRKPDLLGAVRFGLLVGLAIECALVAFMSPRLRLTEVRVSGTNRLTAEQIIERGAVPVGDNIFRVNLSKVARRLEQDPVYRHAQVVRSLPNRLNVHLEEREPALQVLWQNRLYDADRGTIVFQRATGRNQRLPVVEIAPRSLQQVGDAIPASIRDPLWECVELADAESLMLEKIRVDGAGEVWLNVAISPISRRGSSSISVRLGRPTELPEKFRDIRQVLEVRPDLSASAAYLNVMCAGRPAYMRLADRGTGL